MTASAVTKPKHANLINLCFLYIYYDEWISRSLKYKNLGVLLLYCCTHEDQFRQVWSPVAQPPTHGFSDYQFLALHSFQTCAKHSKSPRLKNKWTKHKIPLTHLEKCPVTRTEQAGALQWVQSNTSWVQQPRDPTLALPPTDFLGHLSPQVVTPYTPVHTVNSASLGQTCSCPNLTL